VIRVSLGGLRKRAEERLDPKADVKGERNARGKAKTRVRRPLHRSDEAGERRPHSVRFARLVERRRLVSQG
jgi:hypothetical protein